MRKPPPQQPPPALRHKQHVIIKRGQTIGEPAAEDDDTFLFDTFFENAAYRELSNVDSSKFLLLGRTGTGKTAFIRWLERHYKDVIRIEPEALSLQYISNSDIINYFQSRGVKLDLFFQLLWRHVITAELLKYKYNLSDKLKSRQFLSQLQSILSEKKRKAVSYLESFGSDFWLETDARVTQVTQKFESALSAAAGLDVKPINLKADAKESFSEEQKREIVSRAQKTVDDVHIQQLNDVMNWLSEDVFPDSPPHFVVIDDLDLPFASGETRLWLIRALIETCKKFKKVPNVKIVISIRTDLLERVFELTRDEGFQEEKYKGNIVELGWSSGELKELLNRRIAKSFSRSYRNDVRIGYHNLFPDKLDRADGFGYICERTLHRPRDVIAFVNECFSKASGKDRVNPPAIRQAEEIYSADRFNALRDEWRGQFPLLDKYCRPIIGKAKRFPVATVSDRDIEDLMTELATSPHANKDYLGKMSQDMLGVGEFRRDNFRHHWLDALYKVGVIGIKTDAATSIRWNYKSRQTLFQSDINSDSSIYIHPMLWRRFGVIRDEDDVMAEEQW